MEQLLDAIAERPEDPASWSVYADFLQSHGDPRGELVSIMLQRETAPTQKLFNAQRRYLKRYEKSLTQWPSQVLRRGHVTEMRIESPDELATLDEPALRFVDSVTLAIDGDQWDEWCAVLATKRPWRWLTVEFTSLPDTLALAPLFRPSLEHVRLKLDGAVELDWCGVEAPSLQRLVLVDAGRVESIANFPALRELWLLGETEAGDSLFETWASLERIVVANEGELPQNVVVHRPTFDEYNEEPNAFFFVGGDTDLDVVRKLVARMSGIEAASLRIGKLWWSRRPVSVVQMYGRLHDAHLPFGLAIGLHNLTSSPTALIETLAEQAQSLVLGDPMVRAVIDPAEPISSHVRRAFDLAFGSDPGTAILDDVRDVLAVATRHDLVTSAGFNDAVLTVIDPDAPDLELERNDDEEEDDEDEDGEYDSEYEEAELDAYEEPIPIEKAIVKTFEHAMIEADLELELAADDDREAIVDEEPVELDTEDVSDRPELWFEFRDNWEFRASDPDDEPGEVRWPDPEVVARNAEDVELAIATPACETHGTLFETCSSCSALTCSECDKPRIEGMCAACIVELDTPKPPIEQHVHHGRVVD